MKALDYFFHLASKILILFTVFFVLTGFNNQNLKEYKLVFEGKEKSVACAITDSGTLLAPLQTFIDTVGFKEIEECSRCGYDIISSADKKEAGRIGNIYVHWLKNAVTFESNSTIVSLDANTERIEGITYTSLQLYKHLGFSVETNEQDKIITISRQSQSPLKSDNSSSGADDGRTVKYATIVSSGLINGINPCSLSMFLFLLSLLISDRKNILKIGISFCLGKFFMFFILGTLLFNFLSFFNIDWVNTLVKVILAVVVLIFALLNLSDFIAARMEKYNMMVLQLPSSLRKVYHGIISKTARHSSSKYILVIMLLLGMFLSIGEFMCTGQVYLFSVLFLLQSGEQGVGPLLYLLLYSFAFILPLLILTLLVSKGRKVFNLSEKLLERLPAIKAISALLFIGYGIFIIFFI